MRILGANHHFDERRPCPPRDLVGQIVKGRLVSEGEKEKNSVCLFLTGLEDKGMKDEN